MAFPLANSNQVSRIQKLEVTWQGRNIAEVLKLPIEESVSFLKDQRPIVKLAAELGKMRHGRHNLYILDEPTTGLHFGPEGGHQGGSLIVAGTPEAVAKCAQSHTGKALREHLR